LSLDGGTVTSGSIFIAFNSKTVDQIQKLREVQKLIQTNSVTVTSMVGSDFARHRKGQKVLGFLFFFCLSITLLNGIVYANGIAPLQLQLEFRRQL